MKDYCLECWFAREGRRNSAEPAIDEFHNVFKRYDYDIIETEEQEYNVRIVAHFSEDHMADVVETATLAKPAPTRSDEVKSRQTYPHLSSFEGDVECSH